MSTITLSSTLSVLYRQQIRNIAYHMRCLVSRTILYPLRSMRTFNRLNRSFTSMLSEARTSCDVLDKARSVETENAAMDTILTLITELVYIKNNASELIKQGAGSR